MILAFVLGTFLVGCHILTENNGVAVGEILGNYSGVAPLNIAVMSYIAVKGERIVFFSSDFAFFRPLEVGNISAV